MFRGLDRQTAARLLLKKHKKEVLNYIDRFSFDYMLGVNLVHQFNKAIYDIHIKAKTPEKGSNIYILEHGVFDNGCLIVDDEVVRALPLPPVFSCCIDIGSPVDYEDFILARQEDY